MSKNQEPRKWIHFLLPYYLFNTRHKKANRKTPTRSYKENKIISQFPQLLSADAQKRTAVKSTRELGGRVPYGRKFDFVKSSKAKWEVEKRMRC
jgi:hypothetical protein